MATKAAAVETKLSAAAKARSAVSLRDVRGLIVGGMTHELDGLKCLANLPWEDPRLYEVQGESRYEALAGLERAADGLDAGKPMRDIARSYYVSHSTISRLSSPAS